MKTALNQLIENINLMIEMAEIDKIKATEVNSFTLKARAEGQIQAFNMMLKEIESLLPTEREQTESLKKEIEELRKERFKKPETKQLIDMAILFNEGVLDKEKLSDMLAYAEFIIDRLHENGDILIPSSFESLTT